MNPWFNRWCDTGGEGSVVEFLASAGPSHSLVGVDRRARVQALRGYLQGESVVLLPGVYDAVLARMAERSGFRSCYVTGAGVANAEFALPDVGLVSQTEMAEQVRRMARATALPIVADADTGYGGPLTVMRTVSLFEDAGAAGLQIEDQAMPKRCGHFDGTRLVDAAEMVAKIVAAEEARTDGTVLIARTDALAVEGFDAAIRRARAYASAGADVLFVEAPRTLDELRRIPQELPGIPLVANVVEGGKSPMVPVPELAEMGYKIVIYANLALRVMMKAVQAAFADLREHGDGASLNDLIVSWDERQQIVGLDVLDELESRHRARAAALLASAESKGRYGA